jgi:hypothetical protein
VQQCREEPFRPFTIKTKEVAMGIGKGIHLKRMGVCVTVKNAKRTTVIETSGYEL